MLSGLVAVLSDAGYEVSTNRREGMKGILAFDPDAVVLSTDPPQLDCCDLLSEIKGSEHTHNIRVVMYLLEEQPRALEDWISGPMISCLYHSTRTTCCRGFVPNYGISRQHDVDCEAESSDMLLYLAGVNEHAVSRTVGSKRWSVAHFLRTIQCLFEYGVRFLGITSCLPTIRELTNLGQHCAITPDLPAPRHFWGRVIGLCGLSRHPKARSQ
jgi:hypothetical protein